MKEEEKILIEEAKHGSKKAFKTLYDKYYRLIRYIIFNATKDEELTADLASITFVKAYERLHYFAETISFEAWLKTIAINTVIDHFRREKNKQNSYSIDDEDNTIQISTDNDPETDFIKNESIEILKCALTRLRTKYRRLLELRYFENLSYEELSAKLGIPVGTVKSDLNKAKHKLKHFFQIISKSNES